MGVEVLRAFRFDAQMMFATASRARRAARMHVSLDEQVARGGAPADEGTRIANRIRAGQHAEITPFAQRRERIACGSPARKAQSDP